MEFPKFILPVFRLVRSLELVIDHGNRRLPIRVEIFQDTANTTHFRYRVFGLEVFYLQPSYHDGPLAHEVFTTLCLPNLGAGDYFEVANVDLAEKKFFEDFEREFAKTRGAKTSAVV